MHLVVWNFDALHDHSVFRNLDDQACAKPICLRYLPFAGPSGVVSIAPEPLLAEPPHLGESPCSTLGRYAWLDQDERVDCRRVGARTPSIVEWEGDPLDARPEAGPRRGRPADFLDEVVVAPATRERRVLVLERSDELPRGAGVVVEPADERRLDSISDSSGVEVTADDPEALRARGTQRLADLRRFVECCPHGLGLGRVVVEDPQRAHGGLLSRRLVEP